MVGMLFRVVQKGPDWKLSLKNKLGLNRVKAELDMRKLLQIKQCMSLNHTD
jgi:hypothetical protein